MSRNNHAPFIHFETQQKRKTKIKEEKWSIFDYQTLAIHRWTYDARWIDHLFESYVHII